MQSITLLVALVASGLVWFISPLYGLIIYVATFIWYPTYLSVPVGTIDFTVRRIVILAIFTKLFLITDLPRRFRFVWLDKIVIIYFAAQILAGATTASSIMVFLENRAGAVLQTVLPYFAVRMIVRSRQQYLTLLKGILIIAVPLAIVGFYECLTGRNPVGFMRQYCTWTTPFGPLENTTWERSGFFRASVGFFHPIMYGLYFAMFGPVCAGILGYAKKHKVVYWTGLVFMGIGVLSSMSSGPWLAALLAVSFLVFYHWRRYWKPIVITIVVMSSLVEIISNRHFYEVLADFIALDSHTAWYRSRLINIALFEGGMSGHWLTGFGHGVDPGWQASRIYGFGVTDMVNHYLLVLVGYGLVGFIPFLVMNMTVIKQLIDSFKASILKADHWLIWCLSASIFGLAGAFFSVSIYGPPVTAYYMMIGFCGSMPSIVNKNILVKMKQQQNKEDKYPLYHSTL